jgi:carboxyl-terminal processing protease
MRVGLLSAMGGHRVSFWCETDYMPYTLLRDQGSFMKNTLHSFLLRTFVFVFTATCLIGIFIAPLQGQVEIPVNQGETASPPPAMDDIASLLAAGHFEQAGKLIDRMDPAQAQSPQGLKICALYAQYRQLHEQMDQAYHKSFDEYLQKMRQAIDTAHWRDHLLKASENYTLTGDEKPKFEQDQRAAIQKQWLTSLSQMTLCQNLIETTALDETLDPQLRQTIVDQVLQYAAEFEREQKWLESYQKVYSYLSALEPTNEEYERHARELIRKASLVNLYVPDPNQASVSWEERRKDITFDIITTAMGILNQNYVEQPDYNTMSRKALEYCQLLAETPALSKTFPSLGDEAVRGQYQKGVTELLDQIKDLPSQQYGYYYLLTFLRKVMRVNDDTIKLPAGVMMAEFAEGAFSSLDSYTYVVWPGDVEEFRKDMTGEFSGIGILISKLDGLLKVSSLLEDSPAGQAGIDAGDTILAINGENTANITLDMAVRKITGPENTPVVLSVSREGFDKPRDFTVTRRKIVVNDVRGLYRDPAGQWQYYIDPDEGIAYIHLTNFYAETAARVRDLYQQFKQKNLKGLVLDLRNNSGGFLSTAVQIVNEFVDKGVIVSTRRRDAKEGVDDRASPDATLTTDLPLVVLVNDLSASASEIVAGSLKDHHRALIVGTQTFGKGNVQTIQPLRPSLAEMKITIAYYYLPSGRRVHRDPNNKINKDYGVIPDVPLPLAGSQVREMYELQQKASILHQNGGGEGGSHKWDVFDASQLLKSDPQLQLGILCLKAAMLRKTPDTL